jgi:Tfp pilus assembly protein PilN
MPQQINLSTPILLKQKRYFSARMMLGTMAIFLVVGGGLAAYGVASLRGATQLFAATLASQAPELASLRSVLAKAKVAEGGSDQEMAQKLQAARALLQDRSRALVEAQQGLLYPGRGHASRMQLVAQTIPAQAWITGIRADQTRMEISGFVQEPAILNGWVARLSASPVLAGQKLSTVKVDRVTTAPAGGAVWSFVLGSSVPASEATP